MKLVLLLALTVLGLSGTPAVAAPSNDPLKDCPVMPILRYAHATGSIWTDDGKAASKKNYVIDVKIPVFDTVAGCSRISDPGTLGKFKVVLKGKEFAISASARINHYQAEDGSPMKWLGANLFVNETGGKKQLKMLLNSGAGTKDLNLKSMALFNAGEHRVEGHSFVIRLSVDDSL